VEESERGRNLAGKGSMFSRHDGESPTRIAELEDFFRRYGDMPREVIVKEDLLRWGVRFSEAALAVGREYRERSYYIFSYDRTALGEMKKDESNKAPDEVKIAGGTWKLRTTIVSTRVYDKSPWEIDVVDERLALRADGEVVAEVQYPSRPSYYGLSFEDGQQYAELVPVIGWGTRVFSTLQRACGFWGDKEECRFCDINANMRALRRQGRSYTPRKDPQRVATVLRKIFDDKPAGEPDKTMLLLSGGTNLKRHSRTITDEDFYLEFVRAAKEAIGDRAPIVLQTVARDQATLRRFKQAGVTCHHANVEVWDKNLFEWLSPGKNNWIGRDEWLRRTVDSVEVFGAGNVTPSLVAGVEMARPHGFERWQDAVASTTEGLEFLMSHGVVPRLPQWCIEPLSDLAADNADRIIPLEYFVNVCRNWYEIWTKYKLPRICGQPMMGPGESLFQNGAFLDMAGQN
jgi:hypothetical protein